MAAGKYLDWVVAAPRRPRTIAVGRSIGVIAAGGARLSEPTYRGRRSKEGRAPPAPGRCRLANLTRASRQRGAGVRAARVLMMTLSLVLALALAPTHHAAGQMPSSGGPPGQLIAYPAGWNVVAVTRPGPPFLGLAYTLQAGDGDYEVISLAANAMLQLRVGYWIYFSHDSNIPLNPVASCEIAIPVSSGGGCRLQGIPPPAGQWIMIGNPLPQPIVLSRAPAPSTPTTRPRAATCRQPRCSLGRGVRLLDQRRSRHDRPSRIVGSPPALAGQWLLAGAAWRALGLRCPTPSSAAGDRVPKAGIEPARAVKPMSF